MNESQKQPHPLTSVGGLAAAAGGWTFAQYTGASGWIPIGAAVVLMLVFSKTPLRPTWFVGAIVVTLAHIIWFTVAGAIGGVWQAVILDIAVLFLCTAALWFRPGIVTAFLLGLLQIASLAYNVHLISSVAFGDPIHRALTAHIVLRAIAIFALITGYLKFRKHFIQSPPTSAIAS